MNDRTDWRSWITPILQREIAAGKSEKEVLRAIQVNHREEVRKLYRAIKAQRSEEELNAE